MGKPENRIGRGNTRISLHNRVYQDESETCINTRKSTLPGAVGKDTSIFPPSVGVFFLSGYDYPSGYRNLRPNYPNNSA